MARHPRHFAVRACVRTGLLRLTAALVSQPPPPTCGPYMAVYYCCHTKVNHLNSNTSMSVSVPYRFVFIVSALAFPWPRRLPTDLYQCNSDGICGRAPYRCGGFVWRAQLFKIKSRRGLALACTSRALFLAARLLLLVLPLIFKHSYIFFFNEPKSDDDLNVMLRL